MNERFDRLQQQLEADRESGASSLAQATLSALHDLLHAMPSVERHALDDMAARLARTRPIMVPLGNALRRWLDALPPESAVDFKARYLEHLQQTRHQLRQASGLVAEHATQLIRPGITVMTHSHSSQVMALFALLVENKTPFQVIVTLSAPGNEGIAVARQLDDWQVPTTVITDAELGLFMPRADINLVGCDAWLADEYFVNKSGTLLQALAARHFGKPFWVLADSFKHSHQTTRTVKLEEMPAAELGCPETEFITPRNIYFETIPARLIDGRIDEHGLHRQLN